MRDEPRVVGEERPLRDSVKVVGLVESRQKPTVAVGDDSQHGFGLDGCLVHMGTDIGLQLSHRVVQLFLAFGSIQPPRPLALDEDEPVGQNVHAQVREQLLASLGADGRGALSCDFLEMGVAEIIPKQVLNPGGQLGLRCALQAFQLRALLLEGGQKGGFKLGEGFHGCTLPNTRPHPAKHAAAPSQARLPASGTGRDQLSGLWVPLRTLSLALRVPPRLLARLGFLLPRRSWSRKWFAFVFSYSYWRGVAGASGRRA